MAVPLLPIAGALLGGLTGYLTSPDDNKLGGTFTGAALGGLTGGIGGMGAKALGYGAKAAGTTASAGRIASSTWNPVSLLKSAYTPDAGGLFNLGMDVLPLATDAASGNLGIHSFSGFGGTMAGTRFGGRELNKAGADKLESEVLQRAKQYKGLPESFDDDMKKFRLDKTNEFMSNPQTSKQGYNMGVGMGADFGLYSLTSGMSKPQEPPELIKAREKQEFMNSPVSRYMQLTGMV